MARSVCEGTRCEIPLFSPVHRNCVIARVDRALCGTASYRDVMTDHPQAPFVSKCCIALLVAMWPMRLPAADEDSPIAITDPPPESGFDDFYAKHISVEGFPVISSANVHDAALREAAWVIR